MFFLCIFCFVLAPWSHLLPNRIDNRRMEDKTLMSDNNEKTKKACVTASWTILVVPDRSLLKITEFIICLQELKEKFVAKFSSNSCLTWGILYLLWHSVESTNCSLISSKKFNICKFFFGILFLIPIYLFSACSIKWWITVIRSSWICSPEILMNQKNKDI